MSSTNFFGLPSVLSGVLKVEFSSQYCCHRVSISLWSYILEATDADSDVTLAAHRVRALGVGVAAVVRDGRTLGRDLRPPRKVARLATPLAVEISMLLLLLLRRPRSINAEVRVSRQQDSRLLMIRGRATPSARC